MAEVNVAPIDLAFRLFKGIALIIDDQANKSDNNNELLVKDLHSKLSTAAKVEPELTKTTLENKNLDPSASEGINFGATKSVFVDENEEIPEGPAPVSPPRIVDEIEKILKIFANQGVPMLALNKLPPKALVEHLGAINFILLDWELKPEEWDGREYAQLPSELRNQIENDVCDFLKKVLENTYCPIFIFSNEDKAEIIEKLKVKGLESAVETRILIAKKSEVNNLGSLKKRVFNWVKNNPSFICLKAWENAFNESKAVTFRELTEEETYWPRVFWKSFQDDDVHAWIALADVISRNVVGRADFASHEFELNKLIVTNPAPVVSSEKIAKIMAFTECALHSEKAHPQFAPGDMFRDKESNIYINIRPVCDTARIKEPNPNLYLLKAITIEQIDLLNERFGKGVINHPAVNIHIIPYVPIDGTTRFLEVSFKDLFIFPAQELKCFARLLPPRSTELAQRYGSYISRPGVMRVPGDPCIELIAATNAEISPDSIISEPSTDEIAQIAYRIWQARCHNGIPGDPDGDWAAARAEISQNSG